METSFSMGDMASLSEKIADRFPGFYDGYVKSTEKYYIPGGPSYEQLSLLSDHIDSDLVVIRRAANKLLKKRQTHQDQIIRSINQISQNIQTLESPAPQPVLAKLGGYFFPQKGTIDFEPPFEPPSEADLQLVEFSKERLTGFSKKLTENMNNETKLCIEDPHTYVMTLCEVGSYRDSSGNLVSPVFDYAKLSSGGYVPIEPGNESRNIRVAIVPEHVRGFYAEDLKITRDELIDKYRWTVDDSAWGLLVPAYLVSKKPFQDARRVFRWATDVTDATVVDAAAAAQNAAEAALRRLTKPAEPDPEEESSKRPRRGRSPTPGRV